MVPVFTDWSAGELGPRMMGRVDSPIYQKGAETLENFFVLEQGGVTKRPGSLYVGAAAGSTNRARLLAFLVSPTENYVVELVTTSLRVWRAGAVVSGPTVTPYTASEIWEVQVCQDHNGLYLAHRNHAPRALVRTATDTFTFGTITFTYHATDGKYEIASGTSNTLVVTTTISGAPASGVLIASDGARRWYFHYASASGTTFSGVTPNPTDYPQVAAGLDLYVTGTEHEYHADGSTVPFAAANKYPSAMAVLGGRFWFAGTILDPQRIWVSEAYGYSVSAGVLTVRLLLWDTVTSLRDELKPTSAWANPDVPETQKVPYVREIVTSSMGMDITVASDENDAIQWLAAGRDLIVGTSSAEWIIPFGTNATAPQAKLMTRFGSSAVQPKLIGQALVFVQSAEQKVREYQYESEQEGYGSPDLTLHSDHIAASGIVEFDYQQDPRSCVYFVLQDGQMAVLSYARHAQVIAWQRWSRGTGEYRSVAIIPEDGADSVYVCVQEGTNYHIERFTEPLPQEQSDGVFLDHSKDVSSDLGTSHVHAPWAGKSIAIVIDGVYMGEREADVSTGTLNLAGMSGTKAFAGYRYTAKLRTMPVAWAHMQFKRVSKVFLRLYRTVRFWVGWNSYDGDVHERDFGATWFTGSTDVPFPGSNDREASVNVFSDDPTPMTIMMIGPEFGAEGEGGQVR